MLFLTLSPLQLSLVPRLIKWRSPLILKRPSCLPSEMSSSRTRRRKILSDEISLSGVEMPPCSKCRNAKVRKGEPRPKCVVGVKSGCCSEYVRKGYSECDVTLNRAQWERLRDQREKLQRDLDNAEEAEAGLLHEQVVLSQKIAQHCAKTLRLRQQLRRAAQQTELAVAAEVAELDAEDVLDPVIDEESVEVPEASRAFHDLLEMSLQNWGLLGGIDLSS